MAKIKKQKEIRYYGTAVVETAIVLGLLLLLTMGTIEYGWIFLKSQQITNAVRQAARVAIRPDATNEQVVNTIDDLMDKAGMASSGYNIDKPDVTSISTGDALTIKITVLCENVALINIPLLPTPTNLGASVTMAKEGP